MNQFEIMLEIQALREFRLAKWRCSVAKIAFPRENFESPNQLVSWNPLLNVLGREYKVYLVSMLSICFFIYFSLNGR